MDLIRLEFNSRKTKIIAMLQ